MQGFGSSHRNMHHCRLILLPQESLVRPCLRSLPESSAGEQWSKIQLPGNLLLLNHFPLEHSGKHSTKLYLDIFSQEIYDFWETPNSTQCDHQQPRPLWAFLISIQIFTLTCHCSTQGFSSYLITL